MIWTSKYHIILSKMTNKNYTRIIHKRVKPHRFHKHWYGKATPKEVIYFAPFFFGWAGEVNKNSDKILLRYLMWIRNAKYQKWYTLVFGNFD